ncbi:Type II secretion system protein E [Syntrophaceticus schinkii]|jgi:type IV pilus assembly protein PilB|uniref:Type II secretion system protein E n=1 Tax=Syntrophaceticus schinkii TaxID=499207 RepID=A0A0B7MAX1_9FIRM|nr:Type II secretion system protein E [Syntrophaceticus schinkii]
MLGTMQYSGYKRCNYLARQGQNYLGDLLVKTGAITKEQLEHALKQQSMNKGSKGMLGRTLVQLGYCTEDDIAGVVALQNDVPYVSLETYKIDDAASSLITPEIARRYSALPIGFDKGKLLVAMMHPKDIIAIDDLRIHTGYDFQPVVCADGELMAAIERYSRTCTSVEQTAEEEVEIEEVAPEVDDASEKPAVHLANTIFNQAVRAGTSDIHIEPQEKSMRVRFRIDGVLHDAMQPPKKLHAPLVSRIKVMANMDIAERRIPQDGRISLKIENKAVDVRVATLPTAYGEKVTMRLLNRSSRLITLEELGFPLLELEKYRRIVHMPYGFILVTGPTGSGKSTTLYATLSAVNSVEKNIITVEDPIEYRLDGLNQVQVNVRAGLTFANGLRSILRSDPDIIMIGEIRDAETARIAVESALTGHLVFSTIHTNDAAGAITRLGDMGIETFLTASSLAGVVAQRLARILCTHCKEAYEISRDELLSNIPDFPLDEGEEKLTLYRSKGCFRCSNTGYKGRVGIYELLLVNEEIQRLTLKHASSSEINDAAVAAGMTSLRQDGLRKVKQGVTSVEEIMRVIV